jgi:hypothetical protein
MKKRKYVKRAVNDDKNHNRQVNDASDDENQGFGNWLQSSKGVAYMKLFVISNVIVMFILSWPSIVDIIGIIASFFTQ